MEKDVRRRRGAVLQVWDRRVFQWDGCYRDAAQAVAAAGKWRRWPRDV